MLNGLYAGPGRVQTRSLDNQSKATFHLHLYLLFFEMGESWPCLRGCRGISWSRANLIPTSTREQPTSRALLWARPSSGWAQTDFTTITW